MADQLELFRFSRPTPGPLSTHHIVLGGRLVSYALRRDRRRLSLRVDERGLSVGAPRRAPQSEIEAFLHLHAAWVIDKLAVHAERTVRRHIPIGEGACLPVLGEPVRVRVTTGANRAYWHAGETGGELWLAARPDGDLSSLAQRALRRRANEVFRPRLAAMATRLGCPVPPLGLSSARTRWGSCSARGGIRLNWRLIHFNLDLIDYVIAHEVAHLIEMNHGPRFWHLVERLYPDWRAARDALRRQGPELPLI